MKIIMAAVLLAAVAAAVVPLVSGPRAPQAGPESGLMPEVVVTATRPGPDIEEVIVRAPRPGPPFEAVVSRNGAAGAIN